MSPVKCCLKQLAKCLYWQADRLTRKSDDWRVWMVTTDSARTYQRSVWQ